MALLVAPPEIYICALLRLVLNIDLSLLNSSPVLIIKGWDYY